MTLIIRFASVLVFIHAFVGSHGQGILEQKVFNSEIKSVTICPVDQPLDMPIIPLNGFLQISFDDIGEYIRDLEYTIIHCNRDWTRSNLTISEYIDGFDDASLRDFNSSRGPIQDYMHYELRLPNEDISWRKSGNYILKIWDRDNDDEVLMQLRFVVYEPQVLFTMGEIFRSTRQGFFDSHHEISYAVRIKDLGLDDPMRSISSTVIQNHNWNSAIDSIRPRRIFQDELYFDQHNSVVFPSLREHRFVDLRSLASPGFGVFKIEEYSDGINVTLDTDELRGHEISFGSDNDINGTFVIDNTDRLNDLWEVEYAYTLFTLHYFNVPEEADVYLLGGFNNYRVDSTSLMEFDETNSLFHKEILLKQGVYDYIYGVKIGNEPISFYHTEGYDNRAQNDYHVLLYYRPFLGTYDRVLAYGRL